MKRLRQTSNGSWWRMFLGGFGGSFPVGPYDSAEEAVAAPDTYWGALNAHPVLSKFVQKLPER